MKFAVGDRVIVKSGIAYREEQLGGMAGTVASVWPKAGMLYEDQYQVRMEANSVFLVFGEHQLDHDVLGKLANL